MPRAGIDLDQLRLPGNAAGDRILADRSIVVVPDILADAGGVTVSYFEWVRNNENESRDEAQVNARMKYKITRAADRTVRRPRELSAAGAPNRPNLGTAVFVVAIERLARVIDERGIWP